MFDLHSHIIPGIDDGAEDLDTSAAMLKMAASHGTTDLVVTPHVIEGEWLPSWERILEGCCINGGSYLLVELPALEIPPYTEDFFFKLQARGITPVLAHPERNRELGKELERLREWIEKGVLVQMNAPSLNGRMGAKVQARNCYSLIEWSIVSVRMLTGFTRDAQF